MKQTTPLQRLARSYDRTLRKYCLAREDESFLEQAYELGRAAITSGLGVMDMARIHLDACEKFVQSGAARDGENMARLTKQAGTFFLQALSPFEATHRGFRETNDELSKRNHELAERIAEHRRTERALRESEQRCSTLVETAKDVIFSLTPEGRITAINPVFEQITGWPCSAWLDRPFALLIHPEEMELALSRFNAILCGRPSEVWQYRVRKANGEYAVGEFTLSLQVKHGKTVGVFGIGRDITERKRAEEALRLSEERFRLLVSQVKNYAIFLLDPDGRVVSWNAGAERINGYKEEEIVGRHFSCFFPPQDARNGKPQQALEIARQAGRYVDEDWRMRKDGSQFWASGVITPVHDEAGNLRWYAKVVCDMTERKRFEQSLQELSSKLIHAQEEERRRISRELHDEVGQSLTAISVTLAALRVNGEVKPKDFRQIVTNTQKLIEETMEKVHCFARELRPSMLDELGLLPALRSHVKNFSELTGVRTLLRTDPAAEQLNGEQKTALFRVLQESLTNVAKHAGASRVNISLCPSDDCICMEIADNGKSFREGPEAAAKQQRRLGLLGMQERVRLVNGQFSILPDPGRGTTVRVIIPFQDRMPEFETKV